MEIALRRYNQSCEEMNRYLRRSVYLKLIAALVLFCAVICIGPDGRAKDGEAEAKAPYLDIYYFHDNPCEACHEDVKFMDMFNDITGDGKMGLNYNIYVEDIFKEKSKDLFQALCDRYDIAKDKRKTPSIFIGSIYLQGGDEIKKRLGTSFLKAKEDFLEKYPQAIGNESTAAGISDKGSGWNSAAAVTDDRLKPWAGTDSSIVFFYVTACEDCEKVQKVLEELDFEYKIPYNGKSVLSKVELVKYNVGDIEGLDISRRYINTYHVAEKDQLVPLVFIGNKYFAGGKISREELEKAIMDGDGIKTLLPYNSTGTVENNANLKGYSYTGIFLTGLVNGINPCSLSMLLFFFSLLLAKSKKVAKFGLTFILGKFLAYLALGTAAYDLFLQLDAFWFQRLQTVLKLLLLAAVAILAFMNIRDFYFSRKERYGEIKLQLPSSLRKINHRWVQRLTSSDNIKLLLLVSFSLGLIVSVGEFLCTGQIYLATIILVLRRGSALNLQAASSFLIYVSGMMIPLLIITLLIHKGKELFELSEAIRTRLPLIKMINAGVFLLFAVFILVFF